MRIEVDLTPADHMAFSRFVLQWGSSSRYTIGGLSPRIWVLAAVYLVIGIALPFVSQAAGLRLHMPTIAFSVVMFLCVFAFAFLLLRARRPSAFLVSGRFVYTISPEGVREESAHGESLMRWSGVRVVHDAPEHIFVVGQTVGAIFPKRCLGALGPETVLAKLREHWGPGRTHPRDA